MTSKTRLLALAGIAGLVLSLAACAGTPAAPVTEVMPEVVAVDEACAADEGVTIVVETGDLDAADDPSRTWCVFTSDTIAASDAVELAGVTTEGTTEYPDQIVCRVNGVPSEDTDLVSDDGAVVNETCESMPPAFAYWSLWVMPAGSEWGYAQEGLSTLQLEPGDSVGLLFTLNGEPASL